MGKISVVINTLNEEKNLPRAIASVKSLADEIVVCDMESSDATTEVAEKAGAMVYTHKKTGYVEPARNFAIGKVSNDWILILDADEEIPHSLATKLREIVEKPRADYFRIPRRNIVFGKWMKYSRWWPDFNIRFFKKGFVTWNEVIHSVPMTQGRGEDLAEKEELAIVHYNYDSIEQYLERMNRYTTIQAEMLLKVKHKFLWKDLIRKPMGEFMSRYFFGEGYKDGLHGLAAALLQAFSEVILYLKVWQAGKFLDQTISLPEIEKEIKNSTKEINWWLMDAKIKTGGFISSIPSQIKRKFIKKNG